MLRDDCVKLCGWFCLRVIVVLGDVVLRLVCFDDTCLVVAVFVWFSGWVWIVLFSGGSVVFDLVF